MRREVSSNVSSILLLVERLNDQSIIETSADEKEELRIALLEEI